jgi:hypothetical protein
MKPKSTLCSFLAIAGSSLLAVSSAYAQTVLAEDHSLSPIRPIAPSGFAAETSPGNFGDLIATPQKAHQIISEMLTPFGSKASDEFFLEEDLRGLCVVALSLRCGRRNHSYPERNRVSDTRQLHHQCPTPIERRYESSSAMPVPFPEVIWVSSGITGGAVWRDGVPKNPIFSLFPEN